MTSEKLEGNWYRRAVRELIGDIDYVAKLNEAEREWLEVFVAATAGNNMDAQAALTGTPERFRKLYLTVAGEHNARNRDIASKFTRVKFEDELDDNGENGNTLISALVQARSDIFQHYRCDRCLLRADKCVCPKRQRYSTYGLEQYFQIEESDERAIARIDLKRRMQAFDLLPYGENPKDLQPGNVVKICLPYHLFKDAWGHIVEYRPMDGKYLVRVMSKKGLRDRDGAAPKEITMWVAPTGLSKYRPSIQKGA